MGARGCYKMLSTADQPTDPSTIDYSQTLVSVRDHSYDRTSMGEERFLWDKDKDGQVDELGFAARTYWVAPEYADSSNKWQNTLTPELRKKLSEYRALSQDISRMLTEENWRQSHKRDSLEATNQK